MQTVIIFNIAFKLSFTFRSGFILYKVIIKHRFLSTLFELMKAANTFCFHYTVKSNGSNSKETCNKNDQTIAYLELAPYKISS